VNDVVTVTVHQARVVETVVVMVLVVMVYLYHVLCREAQFAECATATLSLEQSRDLSWFARVSSPAGLTSRPGLRRRGFCALAL
jgi:hypothetical protein